MAVRLRSVTTSEDGANEVAPRCEDALKPSTRIVGGRIADKLGSRMGLRLSGDRFLPEQPSPKLFEQPLEQCWPAFDWRATRVARV